MCIVEALNNGTAINFVELLAAILISALIAFVTDFAIGKDVSKLCAALKSGFDSLSVKLMMLSNALRVRMNSFKVQVILKHLEVI